MRIFCAGSTRAYTRTSPQRARSAASSISASDCPVSTAALSSPTMPSRRAMARAVAGWSPVIITGVMPARWASATAAAASGRGGSIKATSPISASPCSSTCASAPTSARATSRRASASTRRPRAAIVSACAITASRSRATAPSARHCESHSGSTDSGAPLVQTRRPVPCGCSVLMRLRTASNGSSATRGDSASSADLSRPASAANAASAVSVGSPNQRPSSPSTASLHKAAARRVSRCTGSASGSPGRHARPSACTSSACMRFCVSVPVLSEQMVLTEPSVSTDGSRRTSAFCPTMRRAPSASSTVTTAGSDSGMAATARLTAVRIMSTGDSPRSTPITKISAQIASTTRASRLPKAARRFCSGVLRSTARSSRPATLPSSVAMPVATTRPVPRPCAAVVPLKAMLSRSPSADAASASTPVCLSTVTDSPVSADSSIFSWAISIRRRSAGTWLPASSSTMSPGTSRAAGTTCRCPERSTVARAAASCCSAASARSARQACTKPITALSNTITRIASVSTSSPITPETTAAPSSTRIMKSLNWSSSSATGVRRAAPVISFVPCFSARRAASASSSPSAGSTPCSRASS